MKNFFKQESLSENNNLSDLDKNKIQRHRERIVDAAEDHLAAVAEKVGISIDDLNEAVNNDPVLKASVEQAAMSKSESAENDIKERWKRRSVERESKIDSLTQIYNRRGLTEDLERRQKNLETEARAIGHERKERAKKFWILWIDFDNFKKINDSYGHDAGDTALKGVAQIIGENLRPHCDVVARAGGDEFAAVVEDDGGDIPAIAERLRKAIEEGNIEHNGNKLPVTVTIGASPYLEEGTEKMIAVADKALYAAKGEKEKIEKEGLPIDGEIPSGDAVKNQVWYFDAKDSKYKRYKK